MTQRDKELFIEEIREIFRELRSGIIDVINGIAKPELLTPTLEKWYAKRQTLNNRHIGIILGCNQLSLAIFPITGNTKADMGQKALPTSPEIKKGETQFDKEFLKKIGIIPEP